MSQSDRITEMYKSELKYKSVIVVCATVLTIFLIWSTASLYGLFGLLMLILLKVGPSVQVHANHVSTGIPQQ